MWLYLILFFIPVIAYFFNKRGNIKDVRFLCSYMILLAFFVGISDMLGGYDRYIYGEVFDSAADSMSSGMSFPLLFTGWGFAEKGYMIYNWFLSHFTENRYIFILITTFLIYILLYFIFYRHMKNYTYALLLFLGLWFFFTFTYLREVVAVAISGLAITYVIKRDFWKFILVVLIAYSFHHSALILLPIYFLPIKKWNPQNILFIMTFCLILGLSGIPSGMFEIFSSFMGDNEKYAEYAEEMLTYGTRTDYLIEAAFFIGYIFFQYRFIAKETEELVYLNYTLSFCAILLLFVQSPQAGRLTWYYMVGLIAFFSSLSVKKSIKPIWKNGLLVVCFFLFFRILYSWGIFLYPYKTFFTDGYRDNDYIRDKYEYDTNYDKDKFYRDAFRFKW